MFWDLYWVSYPNTQISKHNLSQYTNFKTQFVPIHKFQNTICPNTQISKHNLSYIWFIPMYYNNVPLCIGSYVWQIVKTLFVPVHKSQNTNCHTYECIGICRTRVEYWDTVVLWYKLCIVTHWHYNRHIWIHHSVSVLQYTICITIPLCLSTHYNRHIWIHHNVVVYSDVSSTHCVFTCVFSVLRCVWYRLYI